MEEVEIRLVANNKDAVKGIQEVQTASEKLYKSNETGFRRKLGLMEEEKRHLQDLQDRQNRAYDPKRLAYFNKEIEASKNRLNEMSKAGGEAEKKTASLGGAMAKLGGVMALATTAIIFLKSAFQSTGAAADKFEATIIGLKQGFDAIKRAVATMDFKDFIKNVKNAIDEGRRYAEGLDAIDDKMRALKIAEAEGANALLKQREIQNSQLKTQKERNEAGKQATKIEEDLTVIRTGIAQQALQNELDNITRIAFKTKDINDQMREQVMLYVKRDAEFMKGFAIGEAYNKLIADQKANNDELNLSLDLQGPYVDLLREKQAEYAKKVKAATDEQIRWGLIAKQVTIPTDEKYNILTERFIELEQAKGSALENTMRIRSKLAGGEAKVAKADSKPTTEKERYEFDKKMRAETQRLGVEEMNRLEKEYQDKVKLEKEYQTEVDKIQEEFIDKEIKRMEDKDAKEKKDKADNLNGIMQLTSAASDLTLALYDKQFTKLEQQYQRDIKAAGDDVKAKERIEASYLKKKNELARKAAMAEKISALFSIGINTAVAITKALPNLLLAALIAAAGALQAAVVASKPIPQYAKGGWTGNGSQRDSSGERMAGIVHEREFVVRKGPAHKFRSVLEAINREDKRAIFNSFNKLTPELIGTTNNIVVQNEGQNKRLDEVNSQLRKLNNKEEISQLGNKTVYKKGNTIRIINHR